MKYAKTIFYMALLVSLIIFLNSKTIFANEAQSHIFRTGINLGQIEARLYFLERVNYRTPLTATQASAQYESTAINLRNATNHINTAETLFQGIRSPNRKQQIRNILNRISRYSSATARQNYRRKIAYIKNILNLYRTTLSVTYVSSRSDTFQSKPTCDSKILSTGYHFGRAVLTSTIFSGNSKTRRELGANNYQKNAYGAMSNVIDSGLRLAVDGYPEGRPSDNVTKVCCSFGVKRNWQNFLKLIRWDSSSRDYVNAQNNQVRVIKNTNVGCGGNPSQHYGWVYGRWHFGRKGASRHLCTITLTNTKGTYGFVIRSCHANESYWVFSNNTLLFKDKNGNVTSRLKRLNQNYLEGPYIPKRGSTNYLRRVKGLDIPIGVIPEKGNTQNRNTSCRWRPKTALGQTVDGCECWCGSNKSSNSKCGGTPPPRCSN